MASSGMTNTGFSESSQVSMYNTYQNRITAARESFKQAVQNYDNSIAQARLQNNSVLAEIAYQTLQSQLELALQGFQYKNDLILEQANKKAELKNTYYNRYLDVLNQINTENELAEKARQFNERLAFDTETGNKTENDNLTTNETPTDPENGGSSAQTSNKTENDNLTINKTPTDPENGGSNTQTSGEIQTGGGTEAETGEEPTINEASRTALGLGTISDTKLAELVVSGDVLMTVKDGEIYFGWNPVLYPNGKNLSNLSISSSSALTGQYWQRNNGSGTPSKTKQNGITLFTK